MVWVCTLLRKYAGILVLLVFAVSMQPVAAMAQGDPRKVRLIAPQTLIDTGVDRKSVV